jgi:dihydropteroate synthase
LGQSLPWGRLTALVGADTGCISRVTRRDRIAAIFVDDLAAPAASILKQCMLSGGADALVHREVLTCRTERSNAVVYGTPAGIYRGCLSLEGQPFGLGSLAEPIRKCVDRAALPETLQVNATLLNFSRIPIVMGILNVTPDSFSDGGSYPTFQAAADQALKMEEAGADIIDIGGESTRPGSRAVSAEQQKLRVVPVIKAIREVSSVPISIDTTFPEVARAAVKAGAGMINSVNGLETHGMPELAVSLELPVVVMHMKGTPETMQGKPFYRDATGEITDYLVSRVEALVKLGMPRELILVDPGIGFGKRLEDNLELIRSLKWIAAVTECRVLMGHSRKSFLGSITGIQKPDLRDSVTHVVTVLAEGADVVRVHDVQGTVAAFKVAEAVKGDL